MIPERLLLLDDSEAPRMTFAALLEDAGYQVIEAGSLRAARAFLADGTLQIAVLDLHLPDGLGTELIPELLRSHPEVTVAVLSGDAAAPAAGVDLLLTKGDPPASNIERITQARRQRTGGGHR